MATVAVAVEAAVHGNVLRERDTEYSAAPCMHACLGGAFVEP